MKNKFLVISVLGMALAACEGKGPQPVAEADKKPAVQGADTATPMAAARFVELGVQDAGREPLLMVQGQAVTSSTGPVEGGALTGVAVEIGNFAGQSTGSVGVRVCQAEDCVNAAVDLAGSTDNSYLVVQLPKALNVVGGQPVEVNVARLTESTPFALWTYPSETSMTLADGTIVNRSLKIGFYYEGK